MWQPLPLTRKPDQESARRSGSGSGSDDNTLPPPPPAASGATPVASNEALYAGRGRTAPVWATRHPGRASCPAPSRSSSDAEWEESEQPTRLERGEAASWAGLRWDGPPPFDRGESGLGEEAYSPGREPFARGETGLPTRHSSGLGFSSGCEPRRTTEDFIERPELPGLISLSPGARREVLLPPSPQRSADHPLLISPEGRPERLRPVSPGKVQDLSAVAREGRAEDRSSVSPGEVQDLSAMARERKTEEGNLVPVSPAGGPEDLSSTSPGRRPDDQFFVGHPGREEGFPAVSLESNDGRPQLTSPGKREGGVPPSRREAQGCSGPASGRRVPLCSRCRNHGVKNELRGHKGLCNFKDCTCSRCVLVRERQAIMARQVALTRVQQQQERSGKVMLTPPVNAPLTQPEPTGDTDGVPVTPHVPPSEMSLESDESSAPAPAPAVTGPAPRDQVERSLMWAADICRLYPQIFSLIYIIFKESSSPAEALAWFRNLIQRSMEKRASIWQPWNMS